VDFTINGFDYKAGKLNAKQQFHIVRRVAPVLAGLAGGKDENDILKGAMSAISSLSDSDADFVLFGLLGCVERKDPTGGWGKVSTGELLMYADIDFAIMLQIAAKAFEVNFAGFLGGLGSTLTGLNPKPKEA